MNTILLIEKLREIERVLELEENPRIRRLLTEAQQYALQVQHETTEQVRRDTRATAHP
ncbi:MAG TPA: hypothetical protein VHW46_04955 [Terracidiphilus sp.]|jgi:hypothetical protein|nr:hypothetical protein [Terracidiphilus sp.]